MQEGPERAIDQRRLLVDGEVAHVEFAQLELDTRHGGTRTGLLEHCRRSVDSGHWPTGRLRNRNGDPAVPDSKLDERPAGLARELDIEGDLGRHVRRPLVVATRERSVPSHRPMLWQRP